MGTGLMSSSEESIPWKRHLKVPVMKPTVFDLEFHFACKQLAVSQLSCSLRVAWQLGTERASQPNHMENVSKICHRSSGNTFACSNVIIQMRPTCVGGVVVTRSPRMSGSYPGTDIGYALLMSSNKSEARVQCSPLVWTHWSNYARTGTRPFERDWCDYEHVIGTECTFAYLDGIQTWRRSVVISQMLRTIGLSARHQMSEPAVPPVLNRITIVAASLYYCTESLYSVVVCLTTV
ncbi:LOW QUALITY PROTEIN: hypothetical protein T265_14066 [Opisthorchis viverrini]|uniref:Uncharacterized protein n=1 Tax=Opisthorchis viverrini TaxID=6198 RepID=A0A074ZFT7_OPIVI|nr:LOW QUALITY PROTEIN: hypothetical protein T265_14066 [Opisthorchis viverrini]KER26141.1 LOW QUALITY PROTEIN: hypothetical protein T265_14066 [Opisthorchis viverrini]